MHIKNIRQQRNCGCNRVQYFYFIFKEKEKNTYPARVRFLITDSESAVLSVSSSWSSLERARGVGGELWMLVGI